MKREMLGLGNLLEWAMIYIFCIAHVSLRLVTYALLSAQYRYFVAVVLPLQFLSNLLIGQRFCHDNHQGSAIQLIFWKFCFCDRFWDKNKKGLF